MDTANLQWKRFTVQDLDSSSVVNEEANLPKNDTNQPIKRYSRDQMYDLNKTTQDELGSVCGRLVKSYLEMGRIERRRWQHHERTENYAPFTDMMPTLHTLPGLENTPTYNTTQDESANYRKYIKVTLGLKTHKHAGI